MKEINAQSLEHIAGGTRRNDALNQTLTQVTTSIKDLASNQNNGSNSSTTMMMLALAMSNRNQQTVVAAPPTTVVAAAPAFSFRARFRF